MFHNHKPFSSVCNLRDAYTTQPDEKPLNNQLDINSCVTISAQVLRCIFPNRAEFACENVSHNETHFSTASLNKVSHPYFIQTSMCAIFEA